MQDRVKELIENNTIDELAQMVVDLEAELSVKENMKIVEDCIKKDEKDTESEIETIYKTLFIHTREMDRINEYIAELRKEISGIKKEISEIGNKNDSREFDVSDMFDELTKSRDMERSETPWFYDIFNQRFLK